MADQQAIIDRLIKNSAEVITEDELLKQDFSKPLRHYIGFEISGYVHLGTGLMGALVIRDLQQLGVECTVWLADWHTWINEKLDGTKETAKKIGRGYFTEAIKASLLAVGADPTKVDFRLASEWYSKNAMKFWETVISVSQYKTISRMLRSIDIMGRQQGTDIELAKLLYPAMQVADIFFQEIDIAHAGIDQRKAHVIMRDVAPKIGEKKALVIHHPLLNGLQKPSQWPIPEGKYEKEVIMEMKMSKSKANSAIWIHDAPDEIEQKISKAFCPEKEIKYNPILNWTKHILFWNRSEPFEIKRQAQHGGDIGFNAYEQLEIAYAKGMIHPADLKSAVAKELINLLAPVRDHFAKPEIAAKKAELDKVLANR